MSTICFPTCSMLSFSTKYILVRIARSETIFLLPAVGEENLPHCFFSISTFNGPAFYLHDVEIGRKSTTLGDACEQCNNRLPQSNTFPAVP